MRSLFFAVMLTLGVGAASASYAETTPVTAMDAVARCESLQGGRWSKLQSASTWVVSAAYHAKTADRRAFCDVEGYVNPTVNFGLWLPTEGWSGRLVVRGCGGSCGAVFMDGACGKHLRDGYACMHTDMGHRSGQTDNVWATDNLQGLVDFGYRATHVVTVAGKAILEAFYDGPARYSYFFACSTGGRQAMVEAERFPQDFNGVIAVAPVDIGPFGVSGTFGASNYVPPGAMNADAQGRSILSDLDIPMIYKAVMRACDISDGVTDGLFAPEDCLWDPVAIACRPGTSAPPHTCLTPPQVDLVRRFYAKGAQRGSELNWIDNLSRAPGPQTQFADPRGDPVTAETLMNAGNPDLRVFKARGGKLILAHGTTDLIVLPGQTIDYYETATRVMGGPANTTDFFRLFLIPGMDHCSGGDGAWGVDYLAAATQWVETGKAPTVLTGVHPKPGVPLDYFGVDTALLHADQIAFSRPYFPYPLKAYYSGRGDPNAAASFVAGLKPIGMVAHADPGRTTLENASGSDLEDALGAVMTTTEEAYKTSGLPSENIAARIAKAMRRQLYLADPPRAKVEAALEALLAAKPSPLARPALMSLSAEFAPPPS